MFILYPLFVKLQDKLQQLKKKKKRFFEGLLLSLKTYNQKYWPMQIMAFSLKLRSVKPLKLNTTINSRIILNSLYLTTANCYKFDEVSGRLCSNLLIT